jgi:saxitoxin biosynthesis operon SxtJ-like protein
MTARKRPHEERSFGRGVGGFLVVASVYELWRGRTTLAIWLAVFGVVLLLLSAVAPKALSAPSRVWWRLAETLGWINMRLLLGAFFFLIITPAGLLFRMIGRDPLGRRSRGSTWTPYPERRRDTSHYEKMY